jgi:predicted RNase H-like HicB family nuclease
MRHYLIIIEKGDTSYGAYVPDLPGCVAVGDTRADVERDIRDAIALHLEGLARDSEPIPTPTSMAIYLDVPSYRSRRLTTSRSPSRPHMLPAGRSQPRSPLAAATVPRPHGPLRLPGVAGETVKNRPSRWRIRHWRNER